MKFKQIFENKLINESDTLLDIKNELAAKNIKFSYIRDWNRIIIETGIKNTNLPEKNNFIIINGNQIKSLGWVTAIRKVQLTYKCFTQYYLVNYNKKNNTWVIDINELI